MAFDRRHPLALSPVFPAPQGAGQRFLAVLRLLLALVLEGMINPRRRSLAKSALPGRIPNIAATALKSIRPLVENSPLLL